MNFKRLFYNRFYLYAVLLFVVTILIKTPDPMVIATSCAATIVACEIVLQIVAALRRP
jgi:hypothetical protein